MPDIYMIGVVIVLALCFDFINGFHDTANAIATCVATRALSPRVAIIMSAILNFVGAMISTGVAKTIGGEIVTWSILLFWLRLWHLPSSGISLPGESGCLRAPLMH